MKNPNIIIAVWYVIKSFFPLIYSKKHTLGIFVRITEAILTNIRNICFLEYSVQSSLTSFHSNCRFNKFCHYIECSYKEGWLYLQQSHKGLEKLQRNIIQKFFDSGPKLF